MKNFRVLGKFVKIKKEEFGCFLWYKYKSTLYTVLCVGYIVDWAAELEPHSWKVGVEGCNIEIWEEIERDDVRKCSVNKFNKVLISVEKAHQQNNAALFAGLQSLGFSTLSEWLSNPDCWVIESWVCRLHISCY